MEVVSLAKGGEVFVNKMPVCRIEDLAITMVEELAPHYGYDPRDVPIRSSAPSPGRSLRRVDERGGDQAHHRTAAALRHRAGVPLQLPHVDYDYRTCSTGGPSSPTIRAPQRP